MEAILKWISAFFTSLVQKNDVRSAVMKIIDERIKQQQLSYQSECEAIQKAADLSKETALRIAASRVLIPND